MKDFSFSYQHCKTIQEVGSPKQLLIQHAIAVAEKAYAPYSKFQVGCSVELANGKIVNGSNVENASYPVGICAERTALSNVVSNFPDEEIKSIAISYLSDKTEEIIFPCGMCRQFILECQQRNNGPIEIILHAPKGELVIISDANHLLPFGFTGDMLKA
jgi:cytidine deaminase